MRVSFPLRRTFAAGGFCFFFEVAVCIAAVVGKELWLYIHGGRISRIQTDNDISNHSFPSFALLAVAVTLVC